MAFQDFSDYLDFIRDADALTRPFVIHGTPNNSQVIGFDYSTPFGSFGSRNVPMTRTAVPYLEDRVVFRRDLEDLEDLQKFRESDVTKFPLVLALFSVQAKDIDWLSLNLVKEIAQSVPARHNFALSAHQPGSFRSFRKPIRNRLVNRRVNLCQRTVLSPGDISFKDERFGVESPFPPQFVRSVKTSRFTEDRGQQSIFLRGQRFGLDQTIPSRPSRSLENRLDTSLEEVIRLEGLDIDPAADSADRAGIDDCYRSFIPIRSRYQESRLVRVMDDELDEYFAKTPRCRGSSFKHIVYINSILQETPSSRNLDEEMEGYFAQSVHRHQGSSFKHNDSVVYINSVLQE